MAHPSAPSAPKIPTRFLCISDTLTSLDLLSMLPGSLPACDVLLHTGNMARSGLRVEYEKLFRQVKVIKADLKLFIGGPYDIALDHDFYVGRFGELDRRAAQGLHGTEYSEHMPAIIRELMAGPLAKAAGITYLDEGMHEFVLRNGARMRLYASPFTPKPMSNVWSDSERCAFQYAPKRSRFDPPELIAPKVPFPTQAGWYIEAEKPDKNPNPIPKGAIVDVVMTNTPPYRHLDPSLGQDTYPRGCPHLLFAVERAAPKLHAFGRVIDGWGSEIVKWAGRPPGQPWNAAERPPGSGLVGEYTTSLANVRDADQLQAELRGFGRVDVTSTSTHPLGHLETLFVNARVQYDHILPRPGMLVTIDLDRADGPEPADDAAAASEADTIAGSNPDAEMTSS